MDNYRVITISVMLICSKIWLILGFVRNVRWTFINFGANTAPGLIFPFSGRWYTDSKKNSHTIITKSSSKRPSTCSISNKDYNFILTSIFIRNKVYFKHTLFINYFGSVLIISLSFAWVPISFSSRFSWCV